MPPEPSQPAISLTPEQEQARLAELRSFEVLDTDPDPVFDELVELAVEICGTPIGLISLIDETRQWFKAKIGLEVCETARNVSFCRHALARRDPLIVPDAHLDPRFADSELVTGPPYIRFYAGVPLITQRGQTLGTLCVIDTVPRTLDARQIHTLERLARQVTQQLEFRRTTRLLKDEMAIRQRTEASLRRTNRVLTDLAQHESMYLGDLGSALSVIASSAVSALEVESATIRLLDVDRNRLEVVHRHHAPPGRSYATESLSPIDVGRAFGNRSLLRLSRSEVECDDYARERFASLPPEIRSVLDVAVRVGGGVVGLVSLKTTNAARTWSLEDETIGVMLSAMVALTLETAERTETAEQLRQAKIVIERSPTILFRWRPEPGWPVELVSDNVVQLGYSPSLFLSGELLFADIVHPEDLDRVAAEVKAYLDSGTDRFMQEYRIICGDGRIAWLEDHTVVDRDEDGRVTSLQGILMDVSERKAAERDLARAHAATKAILEAATEVAIIATDTDGLISTFNAGAEKMLGYTADEMVGRLSPIHFHLPEEVEAHEREVSAEFGRTITGIDAFVERAKRDGVERQEWTYMRKDGTRLLADLVVTVVRDSEGRANGYLGVSRDITAWKQAESALAEAKLAAEAANHAKSAFLANMSHEIRTPMTAILGFTDLLHDATLPETERAHALESIRRNGHHLLALINDVLDHSKIEAAGMTVELMRCATAQVVREVESAMRQRAESQGLDFTVHIEPGVPETICSDPLRLRQILLNLVGNAIKFTRRGGVDLRVSAPSESLGRIDFIVRDTGVGMDAEQMARLFKPFSQADASTTRRFGGTGLGLAISKGLARQLGGDIVAESMPGKGSTFTLSIDAEMGGACATVPATHEAPSTRSEVQQEMPARSESLTSTALSGMRVLVAEDGPDNQRLLRLLLERAGATIDMVDNGRDAVTLALQAWERDQPFHCVLMDMQMPELDGYDAARELRSRGYDGPIVAITAHAMAHDREKCLDAGCDDYLSKPVDRQLLRETLRRYAPSMMLRRRP